MLVSQCSPHKQRFSAANMLTEQQLRMLCASLALSLSLPLSLLCLPDSDKLISSRCSWGITVSGIEPPKGVHLFSAVHLSSDWGLSGLGFYFTHCDSQ